MGREIRRVPPDWEHPKDNEGDYQPLYDEYYDTAAKEWLNDLALWQAGQHPDQLRTDGLGEAVKKYSYYWEWQGPPDKDRYRQRDWTSEEATAYQVYETVTEGTPKSPVLPTKDDLIAWLTDNGYTPAGAEQFIETNYAPFAIFSFASGLKFGPDATNVIAAMGDGSG